MEYVYWEETVEKLCLKQRGIKHLHSIYYSDQFLSGVMVFKYQLHEFIIIAVYLYV